MHQVTFYVETNRVGSRCEVTVNMDDEEWEDWQDMSDKDRGDVALDVLNGQFEYGWEED